MIRAVFAVMVLSVACAVRAAVPPPAVINSQGLEIRVRPHAPSQMAAFYEARGFPSGAIPELEKACFMTVSVANKRKDIVWLEPATWTMKDASGGTVPLFTLERWIRLWHRHQVSAAAQTAFRWTQLPRERDLRPEEPVGGNISFAPTAGPYRLTARFRLGPNKTGGPLMLTIPGLRCPGRK
jgi:hypothetical protein